MTDEKEPAEADTDKKWVQHLQVRNTTQLDGHMKAIQELLPGASKSQIVSDALFLFEEFAKAKKAGAKIKFDYGDGRTETILLVGGLSR